MDKALVLITLEPTAESEVIDKLRKLNTVLEANFLYGPYDAYVMIEAPNTGALQDVVIEKIRNIDGINSTMTCFIAE
ncbi:MAG: Lrp/AsnC ligand binding domain-containing protein [Candidatus Bathyarchaeota archaeon]|nr:Lrp/AsnC ligand binding domain-containing protein [Candidatus Bathyarchaeota archaeon]